MFKYTKKAINKIEVGDQVKTEDSDEYREVTRIDKYPTEQSVLIFFGEIKKRNSRLFIRRLDREVLVRIVV